MWPSRSEGPASPAMDVGLGFDGVFTFPNLDGASKQHTPKHDCSLLAYVVAPHTDQSDAPTTFWSQSMIDPVTTPLRSDNSRTASAAMSST